MTIDAKIEELLLVANEKCTYKHGRNFSKFITENKDKLFTVIEPGGNNGDKLLYNGLIKELNNTCVNYEEIKPGIMTYFKRFINKIFGTNFSEISINNKTDIILIGGSGGIGDIWGHLTVLFNNIITNYDITIVVAPSTFYFIKTDFNDILKKAKQDISIFCREDISYSFLCDMQLSDNIKIYLSDDTAFYLNKEDFAYIDGCDTEKEYVLLCLRTDKESKIHLDNKTKLLREILAGLNMRIITEDISVNCSLEDFIKIVKHAKIVVTDRLHVGILSSILEKPTLLLQNSYFKNKAVYEYSLIHFPRTILLDSDTMFDMEIDNDTG